MSVKKLLKILIFVIASVAVVLTASLLINWTDSIESRQRTKELRSALREVIDVYGEKGLLEMVGIPVNDIYYSDEDLSLFLGDNASWKLSADELQNVSVYEKCNQAVVHIDTKRASDVSVSSFLDVSVSSGVGSGFFISEDGYILTNRHVISDASEINVTLADGTRHTADLVGIDEENDIAVLHIKGDSNFNFLEFGDSDSLIVGQKVFSLGNPFGYDRSMASGIISGLSRPIRNENGQVLLGMIQTDAPVNPGNSGGPLLNAQGKVIGINTSIYSTTGVNQGMNFAVASNTAFASAQDLIHYGKINRGWIDIVPVQLSESIVEYANLKVSKGILVSQVAPRGKAAAAGLKGGTKMVQYGNSVIYIGGDVITSVNGTSVSEYGDLFTALSGTRPGDKVSVVVNRDGHETCIKVELVQRTSENVGWINR